MTVDKEDMSSPATSPTVSSSLSFSDESNINSSDSSSSPEMTICTSPDSTTSSLNPPVISAPNTRVKRLRANDRERRRVHLINCAMDSLRNAVPGLKDKRKLTKLELLRGAYQYIWLLDQSLRTGKSIDELLNSHTDKTVYYIGHEFPTLKREMQPMY